MSKEPSRCQFTHGLPCIAHIGVLGKWLTPCEVCAPHVPQMREWWNLSNLEDVRTSPACSAYYDAIMAQRKSEEGDAQ